MKFNNRLLSRKLTKKDSGDYFWDPTHAVEIISIDSFYYFRSKCQIPKFREKDLRFRISRSQLDILLKKYK